MVLPAATQRKSGWGRAGPCRVTSVAERETSSRAFEWALTWHLWIVQGGTHADKAKDFTGKGRPRQRTQENCSATWLKVSVFFGGNAASFWVVSSPSSCLVHTWSGSGFFLVTHIPPAPRLSPPSSQPLPDSQYIFRAIPCSYYGLLLWDSSCEGLLLCLAKVGRLSGPPTPVPAQDLSGKKASFQH